MMSWINSILTSAFAAEPTGATAQAGAAQGSFLSMLPMLLIFILVFYFLIIRPQSKRSKEHKNLMGNLKPQDEVVTIGGIVGKITRIEGDFIALKINAVSEVTVQKRAIASVLPKGSLAAVLGSE